MVTPSWHTSQDRPNGGIGPGRRLALNVERDQANLVVNQAPFSQRVNAVGENIHSDSDGAVSCKFNMTHTLFDEVKRLGGGFHLEDELIVHSRDLDADRHYRETIFNFAIYRRTEHYGLIAKRTCAEQVRQHRL